MAGSHRHEHKVFGVCRAIDIDPKVFPTQAEQDELEAPLGEHEHGWMDSCIDGAKLHYRAFLPTTHPPKAVIVFFHGVVSHGGEAFQIPSDGRKTNVALLVQVYRDEHQMAVYALDIYGHGYSEGTRFFIPSWEQNLKDYLSFIQLVQSNLRQKQQATKISPTQGGLPLFLYGQSYGGTLALHAAKRLQEQPLSNTDSTNDENNNPHLKLTGVLLTAPAIIGDLPPYPVYVLLRYVLAPLYPTWTPCFMPNPISADRIWKDEEMLAIRTEPRHLEMKLTGSGLAFRLGTALSLVQALDKVVSETIPAVTVPLYVMHGTKDYGVPLEGTDYLRKHAQSPADQCVFDIIPDGHHDLLSVPESHDYVQRTISWIKQRIEAS